MENLEEIKKILNNFFKNYDPSKDFNIKLSKEKDLINIFINVDNKTVVSKYIGEMKDDWFE